MAAKYLKKHKYKIVDWSYCSRFGEIDLIAQKNSFIVFVEVKLRKNNRFANAMDFVDYHKQNRIRTTAEFYLSQYPTDLQSRFDVIEIYAPEGMDT